MSILGGRAVSILDISGQLVEVMLATDTNMAVSSPTGTDVDSANMSFFTNNEPATMAAGSVVYSDGTDSVRKAVANVDAMSLVVGMASADIFTRTKGYIVTMNEVVLTTSQWDQITGRSGGLVAGSKYYLSNSVAGMITQSLPTSGYIVMVGKAVSPTKLLFTPRSRIQL
jgi:hypothetical protein